MTNGTVTIVNYGMGNLWSIQNALSHLGVESVIDSSPESVAGSDRLILPGVGSFARAMHNLRSTGLADALDRAVVGREVPVLGICLGMQLLAEYGTEDGDTRGLGWIPGRVVRFSPANGEKVPHMGFNRVTPTTRGSRLFAGLGAAADFYFVHSFHFITEGGDTTIGECDYGAPFVAAVEAGHVAGVQFHPEKSQANGLRLLDNFCRPDRLA